jgi:ABC-type sugar transport system substrate-binding protein
MTDPCEPRAHDGRKEMTVPPSPTGLSTERVRRNARATLDSSRWRRRVPRVTMTAAASLAAALAVGACASNAAPAAGQGSNHAVLTGLTTSAGPSDATLSKLAMVDAKADGTKVKVPKETIGYLRYVADDYADAEMYDSFVQAASVLGWKVVQCNGAGVPATMASCMNTLIADHPAAIVNDGIPQSLIAAGLREADAKGIETIYTSGTLSPSSTSVYGGTNLYRAGYTTPDQEMGTDLSQYVLKELGGSSKQAQLIDQTYPVAEWGVVRNNGLVSSLKGTDVHIVATPQADPTNLTEGTNSSLSALLTQYPKAKVVWVTFDGSVGGAAEAVQAKFPGDTFPKSPLLVTFYSDPQTDALIRQGVVSAAVNDSLQWCSWVAVDQLAQHLSRKAALSPEVRPSYGAGLDFWKPQVVTKANVPAGNQPPAAPVNYVTFFKDKWTDEFVNG